MAIFLFADQNFNEISQNFQSIVARLGEWVTGNEKLFHVTGASGNVRRWFSNQTKLDCGFKNYEPNVMGFLICCRACGVAIPTREIIAQWADIVQRHDENSNTMLVMDSSYLTQQARDNLNARGVSCVAAVPLLGVVSYKIFTQ